MRRQIMTGKTCMRTLVTMLVLCLAWLPGAATVHAATETWTGAAGANWNNAGNWSGTNLPPLALDTLVFDGSSNVANTNDFAANTQFNGIAFNPTAAAFTLGGNAVLLGGDINQNSTANQTISLPLVLDLSTVNVNRAAGAGTLSLGQVTLGLAAQAVNVSTMNFNNSASVASLLVQTKSATANVISIATGQTLSINGAFVVGTPVNVAEGNVPTVLNLTGGGNLNITTTTNTNFIDGVNNVSNTGSGGTDRNVATVDMTALNNFTYSTGTAGTGVFDVGVATRPQSVLRLAPGANMIVAASVNIGDSSSTPGITAGGNNGGGTSTLFLGAGTNTINTGSINIGAAKGIGVINWQDATNGSVTIAGQAGGTARANITVGNQSSGSTGVSGTLTLGNTATSAHTASVLAGTVVVGETSGSASATGNGTGTVTFDTGTFDVTSLLIGNGTRGSAGIATGTFTLGRDATSTGVLKVGIGATGSLVIGAATNAASTGVGTLDIKGGAAQVNTDITRSAVGTNTGTLTLEGGTLDLMTHSIGSAASPMTTVNLTSGTLSNTVRINANTININPSTLTMTTAPTFVLPAAGKIVITSGPLTLGSGGGIESSAAGSVSISGGDVVAAGGSHLAPGTTTAAGTLAFTNNLSLNDGSAATFKISDNAASGNDQITVGGNLAVAGTVNIGLGTLAAGPKVGNNYTLFTYTGTLTGNESNFTLANPGSRMTFSIIPTATTPNSVQLAVGGTPAAALTWVGNAANNVWDHVGAFNWVDASLTPQQFFNVDTVTFDDSSTVAGDVLVSGQVSPGSATVNAARNYTFAGTGAITGGTGLVKQNTGTLIIANNNTYTGTTDIQGGTLQIGAGGTTGSVGAGPITNSGTLTFNRSDNPTIANVINDSSNGAGAVVVQSSVTLSGASGYTGTTDVKSGAILKVSTGISAAATNTTSVGAANGGAVTIESGASLDIGGNSTTNGLNLGAKLFHIAGAGAPGTAGAITNTGVLQNAVFNNITLDADATIGGQRIDIGRNTTPANATTRTLDLQGHTLTINMTNGTGAQPIFGILDGATVTPGNITVVSGGIDPEKGVSIPDNGGIITFNSGTNLEIFQTNDGAVARAMVFKGKNIVGAGSTTLATLNSNMELDGNITLQGLASGVAGTGNNPLTLKGNITENGGLFSITKNGPFVATLTGTNNWSGGTNINAGSISVGAENNVGAANGAINFNGGKLTSSASFVGPHNITVDTGGGTLDFGSNSLTTTGAATGAGTLTISGTGPVTVGNFNLGGLSIPSGGSVTVSPNGTKGAVVSVLTVGDNTAATTGKLDLNDNDLITTTPAATIGLLVKAGYNGGAWTGNGITSTAAANSAGHALGYGSSADVGVTSLDGNTVSPGSTVVKYTYFGDSSLDGKVDLGNDFNLFLQGFLSPNLVTSTNAWELGDYNYDGVVNGADFQLFVDGFKTQGGQLGALDSAIGSSALLSNDQKASLLSVVPEPASIGLISIAACVFATRRRRS
jgi:fibronectin-binding autotransporter adhesin